MITEALSVTTAVTDALDQLNVPYLIGGSLASALHGLMRATMDADLVADLSQEQVDPLILTLDDAFYADAPMMRRAVLDQSSFNLIHFETMFKVDVFILGSRPFDRSQMARRQRYALGDDLKYHVYVASAEDTVLAKLDWYRMGGEISERQWSDVLGVLRVQAGELDYNYLERMATGLTMADLLRKALNQAGIL